VRQATALYHLKMNKRAQGLPFSTIVIAAIVVIVLILVVVFTVGGLGTTFRQIGLQQSQDIDSVRVACQTACTRLQVNSQLTTEQFQNSDYCTNPYVIDLDDDGEFSPTELDLRCHGPEINVPCQVVIDNQPQTC